MHYDLLRSEYLKIPDGVIPANQYHNRVPDEQWRETFERVNGEGSFDGIQALTTYYAGDANTMFTCAYTGETVPILPHNKDNNVINATGLKCMRGNADDPNDPESFDVVRSFTWRQDKCAFVDDVVGSYGNLINDWKHIGYDNLPDGTKWFDTHPMRYCPASVQVIVDRGESTSDITDPLYMDLSDQSNYYENFEVQEGSREGQSIVRFQDETYRCAPRLLWNTSARANQPVLSAEHLLCCKGTDLDFTGKCEGGIDLKHRDGVYHINAINAKPV